ncbi:MAG: DNA polymerase I [Candidatus Omnitrophota bacterium]
MPNSKLFLIDAHGLCYRAYFAVKNLSTSYGQATNAVFGFTNILKKILRQHKPEYMAVCFDVGKKTHRQEKFAEYKIHRPAMPDSLISQIPIIKDLVSAFNLPMFELEGFEADDLIATITEKVKKDNLDIVIVSGDKDMIQLAEKNVKIFNVRKDEVSSYEELKDAFGIDPEKIVDYIALAGDQSDNIPGVVGIGEVTARQLINQFGSLEDILANVDRIESSKVKEKLMAQREQAVFSKELAMLDRKVPIRFDLKSLKVPEPDTRKLFELFQKLEFRKFAEEISGEVLTTGKEEKAAKPKNLASSSDFENFYSKAQKKGDIVFLLDRPEESQDILFPGLMAAIGKELFFISEDKIGEAKAVFESPDIVKITHDVKEAMKFLSRHDISIHGEIFDCMLAGYLLAPAQTSFDIATLSWNYLKTTISSDGNLAKKTEAILKIFPVLKEELVSKSLLKLFQEIEIPLAYVLFKMEEQGVCIDEALLGELSKDGDAKIQELTVKLFEMAGVEFNLNSPKQLAQILFEKLKLPVVKKTKTGFSTDEGVLAKLAEKHPLPALILEYRQLAKLKSTYIDALPKLINRKTGRVHASFNQAGTETGRLSSNNPNLQNIPIRTELGRKIRKAFVASQKDRIIVSADYSQIELRILAHLSQDKNLFKAFKSDQDIHAYTAALIFDVKESAVTSEMRNTAKRVNFGIIYGISAFGLAKDLKISQTQAQDFIDKYFDRYPAVKQFMDDEIKKCEKNGFVLTLLNRRRYLPEIHSDNANIKQFAQRQAINTPVQGSAADLLKLAMINIQNELEKNCSESKMIITVHDELVFDVVEKEREALTVMIRDKMEHALSLSVPLKASVKIGRNWLDMQEI